MAREFVGYIPGLLGVEDYVEHNRRPDKVAMLDNAHASPILFSYQTRDNRAPSFDEMCQTVALGIIKQQIETGSNGKIIASSVGAAVLRGALQHMAAAGRPMPDVILVGPVWDIAATVDKLAGKQAVAALLDVNSKIPALPMKVSGNNAGTFPLTREFYLQAKASAEKPLPPLPSLTVLTSKDDIYCNEAGARAIGRSVKTVTGKKMYRFWEGGHNDSDSGRDNDILLALSHALHRPKLSDMLRNVYDRDQGITPAHWRKRKSFAELLRPYNEGRLTPSEEALTRARLNIMRRIRVAPEQD